MGTAKKILNGMCLKVVSTARDLLTDILWYILKVACIVVIDNQARGWLNFAPRASWATPYICCFVNETNNCSEPMTNAGVCAPCAGGFTLCHPGSTMI